MLSERMEPTPRRCVLALVVVFVCTDVDRAQLAKAGFAFTPQSDDDDTATCFYCGIALSGWDEDDNPLYVSLLRLDTELSISRLRTERNIESENSSPEYLVGSWNQSQCRRFAQRPPQPNPRNRLLDRRLGPALAERLLITIQTMRSVASSLPPRGLKMSFSYRAGHLSRKGLQMQVECRR